MFDDFDFCRACKRKRESDNSANIRCTAVQSFRSDRNFAQCALESERRKSRQKTKKRHAHLHLGGNRRRARLPMVTDKTYAQGQKHRLGFLWIARMRMR